MSKFRALPGLEVTIPRRPGRSDRPTTAVSSTDTACTHTVWPSPCSTMSWEGRMINRSVEFGYQAALVDNNRGDVLGHTVERGNASDSSQLAPAVGRARGPRP